MENIVVSLALILLLISVICIYSARAIIINRVNVNIQNKVVLGLKVSSFILAILSLTIICYFK